MSKKLPFSLDPLDPKFVPAKPKHSLDLNRANELWNAGRLIITRKRDGYRHLAVISRGRAKLYTRGIEDVSSRYPHICEELGKIKFPDRTLIDGEILVNRNGVDDFEMLTKIAKLQPAAAITFQQEHRLASFMIFDVLVWSGEVYTTQPYSNRFSKVTMPLFKSKQLSGSVGAVEVLSGTIKDATSRVEKFGWEGLVFYDPTKPTEFRLDGLKERPPRPDGCWKWKPLLEDDFIATRFAYGTGKNVDRMGKLYLAQMHPKTGVEVPCGEVGGGFSDKIREDLAHMPYPLVVQVEFQKRFPSGALRHPQFMRIRDDKSPKECLFPESLCKD